MRVPSFLWAFDPPTTHTHVHTHTHTHTEFSGQREHPDWQKDAPLIAWFSSVPQSCPTLCYPMDCSTPGFPVLHHLPELVSVMPSNHLILCHHLLLLPSVFPNIKVFSKESVLRIRWPKYWCFSFSISPSNEYSGLIAFRMDWLDLLAIQGTLKNLL